MKMVGVVLLGAGSRLRFGRRMMSTNPNPWLMLPPSFDRRRGGMVYNFYSPAEQKEVVINKYGPGPDPPEFPDDNATIVGSSHGWLALMNDRNNDLFLSNPITRRHIKLPPIQSLPNPELHLHHSGRATVSKLILSASPDSPSCRAMASFGPHNNWLAFCRPGHSRDWAPIGDQDIGTIKYPNSYVDFVFSSKRNVFTCLTKSEVHKWGVEDWDLTNLDSPKMDWIRTNQDEEHDCNLIVNEHLAYADQTDDLFILTRTYSIWPRETTFRLFTQRVKREEGGTVERCKCKCPHTMFVGTNHAFAISAVSPHFTPNSIYFANCNHNSIVWGKGDVGIYHCATETVSNFYYPTTTTANTEIQAAPIWFTPTLI